MRLVVAYMLTGFFALYAAPKPARPDFPVTVLLDFERPYSPISLQALQEELPGVLSGTQLKIDFRLKSELPAKPEFRDLVVFKLKGNCSMNALPVGALSDERGPLAMTYSVDGELLPFGEIECDHIRETIQRTLGSGDPEAHQATLGKALALIMAHEMYHMLSKSAKHTKDGVTRESLSGRVLVEGKLALSEHAKASMQAAISPGSAQ